MLLVAGIPVVALLFLPLVLAEFQRIFVAEIFIWGLFAMSFALVYGYGGMLSFAQAVFFGAGCYGFNLGTFYYGFNTWGAIISAVVAATAVAAPIGLIATRARSHHFLIVTVIFSVLVYMILSSGHWRWIAGPSTCWARSSSWFSTKWTEWAKKSGEVRSMAALVARNSSSSSSASG